LGRGFAGGLTEGQVCGAVTGAIMVIGLCYGDRDRPREDTYEPVNRFLRRFESAHGSIICRDLLGCDLETARQNDRFSEVCPLLIRTAAQIIEELIERGSGHSDSRWPLYRTEK
jgi:C_GCAxxG_C_C family probable redox protein